MTVITSISQTPVWNWTPAEKHRLNKDADYSSSNYDEGSEEEESDGVDPNGSNSASGSDGASCDKELSTDPSGSDSNEDSDAPAVLAPPPTPAAGNTLTGVALNYSNTAKI